mmetsp:Transcript_21915/g.36997  ORF Transcript_21915/g.36997 Transcript_21915/m.36997 type:complete len:271 (-) Transcript_21915:67-879(-)
MIAAQRHGTVSRTFEEDDEEVEGMGQSPPHPHSNLKFDISPDKQHMLQEKGNVGTIVYSLATASIPCASLITKIQEVDVIGSIKASERDSSGDTKGLVYAEVYYSKSSKLVLVLCKNEIPVHLAYKMVEIFSNYVPSSVIILGSLPMANYVGQPCEGRLMKIATSASNTNTELDASLQHLLNFSNVDVGNVLTGTAAALLNYYEVRNLPAVLLVTLTKVFLTMGAMRAYEPAIDAIFKTLANEDAKFQLQDYEHAMRNDPYIAKTENLYC